MICSAHLPSGWRVLITNEPAGYVLPPAVNSAFARWISTRDCSSTLSMS